MQNEGGKVSAVSNYQERTASYVLGAEPKIVNAVIDGEAESRQVLEARKSSLILKIMDISRKYMELRDQETAPFYEELAKVRKQLSQYTIPACIGSFTVCANVTPEKCDECDHGAQCYRIEHERARGARAGRS